MKILLATDSRGVRSVPETLSWVDQLKADLSEHDIIHLPFYTFDGGHKNKIATIYSFAKVFDKRDDLFDLAVLQCGLHEWVASWDKTVLKRLIPTDINPSYLKKTTSAKPCWYHDEQLMCEYIQFFQRRCRRILFIGMHSWLDGSTRPEWSTYKHHTSILQINKILSSQHNCDLFDFPMHPSWNDTHTWDKVHYLPHAAAELKDFITRYISRFDISIKDILTQEANPDQKIEIAGRIKTRSQLINDCFMAGGGIAHITQPRDVVAISKSTSFEQIEAFIGCILYNRIPVIIPNPSPKVCQEDFHKKMTKVTQAVSPTLCLADNSSVDVFSHYWKTISQVDYITADVPNCDIDQTAFVQLSSGTTGVPKVIEVTQRQLIAHCQEYASAIGLNSNSTIVSWLPLYHDMGLVACFLLPMVIKCSFVHINPFTWLSKPDLLFDKIEQHHGTHVWMPNFAFSFMTKCNTQANLSSLQQLVSCSEMTSEQDLQAFASKFNIDFSKLRVCYALAENVFAVSQSNQLESHDKIVDCGTVIPGTSVLIVDESGRDVTEHNTGQVCVKSSYSPSSNIVGQFGYYNTGDIGFVRNGHLYICGRSDDMIVSFGKNIFPYYIEKCISKIDGVIPGRVACFGVPKNGTQEICIVFESSSDDDSLIIEITRLSSIILDVPVRVKRVCAGWIIKTSSGKVSRKRCKEKYLERNDGQDTK